MANINKMFFIVWFKIPSPNGLMWHSVDDWMGSTFSLDGLSHNFLFFLIIFLEYFCLYEYKCPSAYLHLKKLIIDLVAISNYQLYFTLRTVKRRCRIIETARLIDPI